MDPVVEEAGKGVLRGVLGVTGWLGRVVHGGSGSWFLWFGVGFSGRLIVCVVCFLRRRAVVRLCWKNRRYSESSLIFYIHTY
jgi:hypothetical protein